MGNRIRPVYEVSLLTVTVWDCRFENGRKMFQFTSNNQLTPSTCTGCNINTLQKTKITSSEGFISSEKELTVNHSSIKE